MDDFLSTSEFASQLGVTRARVLGWIYHRKVAWTRRGRWYFVHVAEVARMRASLRQEAIA